MRPRRTVRNYRRIPQACDNCRRKKIRCPGQRPACSHCERLCQSCHYADSHLKQPNDTLDTNSCLEHRITQLEERFDMAFDRTQSSQEQTHIMNMESRDTTHTASSCTNKSQSGLLPEPQAICRAIDDYFKFAHRQPLWLFNNDGTLNSESSEELLLTVLSIAAQHPDNHFTQQDSPNSGLYCDAARSLIMGRIEAATADLSVLQALCLLAYSNLLSDNIGLARWHSALARTMLQSSGLEVHISRDDSPRSEVYRRLFWSTFQLDYMCGQQKVTPSLEDIHNPRYLMLTSGQISSQCATLPLESYDNEEYAIGVWGHMVRIMSLWTEVSLYLWKHGEGDSEPPWKPNSIYTLINSRMLDAERGFPDSYRYESANFQGRPMEEISSKREYWLPWMRIQINYHVMHCVVNHPFLLSSTKPKTITGTNAFWKTASKLALLHSTWVSRLLEMANMKQLQLSDPSITYAALVAATLHTYWSRSTDATIRSTARKYLQICYDFVTKWGPQWPGSLLNRFLHITLQTTSLPYNTGMIDREKAELMWKILEFGVRPQDYQGMGFFQPFLSQEEETNVSPRHTNFTLGDPDIESAENYMNATAGPYDNSIPKRNLCVSGGTAQHLNHSLLVEDDVFSTDREPHDNSFGNTLPFDWVWADSSQGVCNDLNARFHEQGGMNLDWWDGGIL